MANKPPKIRRLKFLLIIIMIYLCWIMWEVLKISLYHACVLLYISYDFKIFHLCLIFKLWYFYWKMKRKVLQECHISALFWMLHGMWRIEICPICRLCWKNRDSSLLAQEKASFINADDYEPTPSAVLCEKKKNQRWVHSARKRCTLQWSLKPIPTIQSSIGLKRPSSFLVPS